MVSNILVPSSEDLAIIVPENDINAMNSSLYKRAKDKQTFKKYDDWGEVVDLINGSEWNGAELRKMASEFTILPLRFLMEQKITWVAEQSLL